MARNRTQVRYWDAEYKGVPFGGRTWQLARFTDEETVPYAVSTLTKSFVEDGWRELKAHESGMFQPSTYYDVAFIHPERKRVALLTNVTHKR